MSDEPLISDRDWEMIRALALSERDAGLHMMYKADVPLDSYWQGYAAACNTIANAMRGVGESGPQRPIEDIETE